MQYNRMPIEIEAPEDIGYDQIHFNLSESSFTDQTLKSLNIDLGDLVLQYGNHMGKIELRESIADESNMHSSDVMITAGAAMALFIVSTAMLKKGDHLIVGKTNYATNIETPRSIGANISFLNFEFEKGYRLDLNQLKAMITPDTKLVSFTYPHNPSGVTISSEELAQLIQIIEKSNAYLLIDETYREMTFQQPLPVAASLSSRVISISSMSKSYGLPGIRIGWLQCQDKKWMNTFLAAKEQICITNSVIDEEIAYQFLLKKEEVFAKIKETISTNFLIIKQFMHEQKYLEGGEPKGGCVCFPRFKKEWDIDIEKFHHTLLYNYKTYVGKGHWFETDVRHIRIGYSWEPTAKLAEGLARVIRAAEDSLI